MSCILQANETQYFLIKRLMKYYIHYNWANNEVLFNLIKIPSNKVREFLSLESVVREVKNDIMYCSISGELHCLLETEQEPLWRCIKSIPKFKLNSASLVSGCITFSAIINTPVNTTAVNKILTWSRETLSYHHQLRTFAKGLTLISLPIIITYYQSYRT